MENLDNKFIVVNRKYLTEYQQRELELQILEYNAPQGNTYYVVNTDEPYADKVLELILEGEKIKNGN